MSKMSGFFESDKMKSIDMKEEIHKSLTDKVYKQVFGAEENQVAV